MDYSDAYYYQLLLQVGLDDNYDSWLNSYLENEEPLSDVVLELSFCGSDRNKIISCLWAYCCGASVDEKYVVEKLRIFLKAEFAAGALTKEEVVSAMYRLANSHAAPYEFDTDIWGDMYYLEDYYSLAKDGIVPWEKFDKMFNAYLNDGTPIDSDKLWDAKERTPKLSLKTILSLFRPKK